MSLALSEQSIALFESAYGRGYPGLASLYQGQAWDQKTLGLHAAAHASLDRSLEIAASRPADVEFFVRSSIWNTLGDLYVSEGDDPAARKAFEQAIDLWRGSWRSDHGPGWREQMPVLRIVRRRLRSG